MPITLGDLAREIIVAIEQADAAEKAAEAAVAAHNTAIERVNNLKAGLRNELLSREDPANAVQVGGVVVRGCARDVAVLRLADANRPLKDQDAARKMGVGGVEIDTTSFESPPPTGLPHDARGSWDTNAYRMRQASLLPRDPVEPTPHSYDKEFLRWIRNRLVTAHGESPNVDYILRLDDLVSRMRT